MPNKTPDLYTPVQILQYRTYLSIRTGYYVANDSGFGVINGKGEVGNLVVSDTGVVGLIAQIGKDSDYGFLRVVLWRDIANIARRLKNKSGGFYLGISAVAMRERDAISIVRVAPNSPLASHLHMGDVITKVNNYTIKNPDDLGRIIMAAGNRVTF